MHTQAAARGNRAFVMMRSKKFARPSVYPKNIPSRRIVSSPALLRDRRRNVTAAGHFFSLRSFAFTRPRVADQDKAGPMIGMRERPVLRELLWLNRNADGFQAADRFLPAQFAEPMADLGQRLGLGHARRTFVM